MKTSLFAKAGMVALASILAVGPALAQGRGGPAPRYGNDYEDGYRAGYREGYDDGRDRARYDDRISDNRAGRGGDRNARWRERYTRAYSYNDDVYYRECRQQADPAGVIAGALIGGLLGNALGQGSGRGGATVAGVILGGVAGAALVKNLDCEDRSYAYKSYHAAFNDGRVNRDYEWRNPRNDRRGVIRVSQYSEDPYGFRCANFTQTIWIQGRPQEGRGRACQQPDGSWAIVG